MASGDSDDEALPKIWRTASAEFKVPFKLSWSQYVFLVSIENPDERSFYEIEAAGGGWTLPELKRQFNSGLYERLALSRDKDGVKQLATKGQLVARPEDLLKEPCPKMPISTPGNTSSICPIRSCCEES
ncbi:hypothetical protein JCM12296A_22520 [Desulfosarcina cetonica]|uniref:DUF1016 N-terminal domain-containing protein n=1 Tax=Desulfosarcina cetonica TaxID=90730 RepID=UPI0012ECEA23|nr:DUF1016 N-terminal domain-containing protein [Desulfosarcina cetonica]